MREQLSADAYTPISSDYLGTGYKDDDFEMVTVLLEEQRIIGTVKVNRFFPSMNGDFHLSSAMGAIWIQQLGVIYTMRDIGATVKDREVWLRKFSMQCRSRIVSLDSILLELAITSKAERGGRIFYRGDYDIDVGSFVGSMSWYMENQPEAEEARAALKHREMLRRWGGDNPWVPFYPVAHLNEGFDARAAKTGLPGRRDRGRD